MTITDYDGLIRDCSRRQVIENALSLIHVPLVEIKANPRYVSESFRVLMDLLKSWDNENVSITYQPKLLRDGGIDGRCGFDAATTLAITYELAIAICPLFNRTPSPLLLAHASLYYETIRAS